MPSVAEILEAAADLIEPEGAWGQGCAAGAKGAHCADTAIFLSAGGLQNEPPALEAERFFARFIGGKRDTDTWNWNDAPERTQSEVVAKLREAAALARAQELSA